MTNGGWKTVVIEESSKLSYSQGCMQIAQNDSIVEIPVMDVKVLIIESIYVQLSVYLLEELRKAHVKVIICDATHNPSMEMMPYHDNYKQSKCIRLQIEWDSRTKDICFMHIVKQKINMQIQVLEKLGIGVPGIMRKCVDEVCLGDSTNREAVAARAYFRALFGKDFSRNKPNNINSALNYGYSIILALVNRQITQAGYLTNIGINHSGDDNPVNLACDLMEPFRPIVDEIVFARKNSPFDTNFKMELLECLYQEIKYNNKKIAVNMAIDVYVNNILKRVSEKQNIEMELGLCA